jgi:hypothetical protein
MAGRRPTTLLAAALLLVCSLFLATGCGVDENKKTGLFEGEPVELGNLSYNVVFSRYLNPNDEEDKGYLVGQPPPGRDALYLGIFVQIENTSTDASATLPRRYTVQDAFGKGFAALPSTSIFALDLGGTLGPEDLAPPLDSAAQTGPIEGSMILFKIPQANVENRPLSLIIPGQDGPAEVELDL